MNDSESDLPVRAYLPEIARLLEGSGILILSAESGAGKTTLVPPGLLEAGVLGNGKLLMLEPRRIAAIQAATRIARNLGEEPGGRSGYRVRGDSREGPATRITAMTEALLTRMIQADPELRGVSVLVFDEYHERSLNADLALALALEARLLRPELKILIMSATLDAAATGAFIERHQGKPPEVLDVPGRQYPVDIAHRPLPRRDRFEAEFAAALADILMDEAGNVLAFLPGRGEIERVRGELERLLGGGGPKPPDIICLHGGMSLEEQRRAVDPGNGVGQRVILATNIAQTSLTVPGITAVVDSGLCRLNRFHLPTGMDRLVTERESARDAVQRAGRAGRLGPGRAYRLWPQSEPLPPETEAEMLRADLSGLVLEAAIWGARAPEDLPFPDPPPESSWDRARGLLIELGLLDEAGAATPLGKACAAIGVNPRLGSMALKRKTALAAACAALLEERDQSSYRGEADFRLRLESLRTGESSSAAWLGNVKRETLRIRTACGIRESSWTREEEERAGDCLLDAFPDRVCRRDASSGLYRFPSGRTARLPGQGQGEEWLLALEADSGESVGFIRSAVPLSMEAVAQRVMPRAAMSFRVEWRDWRPVPKRELMLGRLSLGPGRGVPDTGGTQDGSRAAILDAFAQRLAAEGTASLPWTEAAANLRERARFLSRVKAPEGFPDISDQGLLDSARSWLFPFLDLSGSAVIDPGRLSDAFACLLAAWRAAIDREAPESVRLPTGESRKLLYGEGDQAILEARVQELFGLSVHPRAAGVPILMRILSPSRRPVQSTSDISGFWKSSYLEVRKELRGRYPKHFWPEDGASAQATSRAKPRSAP
jgi:ATP-dependent helicase HrpB